MDHSSILPALYEIVRLHANSASEANFGPETRFVEDMGIDSFSLVCVAFAVRERFGLTRDPELGSIATLNDLARYVTEQIQPNRALPAA